MGSLLGWSSFVGQFLGVVGFGLLTWDLLPRYLKEKEIRELEAALRDAECIHVSSPAGDGTRFFVNDQVALTKRVLAAWRKFGWHIPENLEAHISSVTILDEEEATKMLPFISMILSQRQRSLEVFDRQPRPPLVVAVIISAGGYALQLLGSLPIR